MSYMTFGTPNWRSYSAAHQGSKRPISATVIAETEKALLLKAATRTVWVPKRWVTPDPDRAVFWIPSRVCEEKLLD
jgi:hypothetical protein